MNHIVRDASARKSVRLPAPDSLPTWIFTIAWIFALLFPLIALSRQSFWIDEAITGNAASQPSLTEWWRSLKTVNGSDVQMPFYMLYVWAWEKLFGRSELALRFANYPWFVLGQVAAGSLWRDRRKGLLLVTIAACHPFVWFYLNEARPYMMVYGAACVLVWGIASFLRDEPGGTWKYWMFAAATLTIAGANMLGAAWSGTALLVGAFLLFKQHRRGFIVPFLACIAALAGLGLFYLGTLLSGARGAGQIVSPVMNTVYLVYEMAGFAGLGPGRIEIRAQGVKTFLPYAIPIGLFAFSWIVILFRLTKNLDRKEGNLVATVASYAAPPVVALLLLGAFTHFSVLARHAIPALPFVFVLLTLGIFKLTQDRHLVGGIVIALFGALAILSCLELRFSQRHSKDDYRGAAAVYSSLPADQTVWWCASWEAAEYYQLPILRHGEIRPHALLYVRNLTWENLLLLPTPDCVILSKPDIYDQSRVVMQLLTANKYVQQPGLQAFSIWKRVK